MGKYYVVINKSLSGKELQELQERNILLERDIEGQITDLKNNLNKAINLRYDGTSDMSHNEIQDEIYFIFDKIEEIIEKIKAHNEDYPQDEPVID